MGIETTLKWLAASREFYIQMIQATPDDRLDWKPVAAQGDATSILEITRHLIANEHPMRSMVVDGKWPEDTPMDPNWAASSSFAGAGPAAEVSDKADLVRMIREAGAETDQAVRDVPDSAWNDTVSLPFMTDTRAGLVGLAASHWSYHTGQVAYLQRLYGDLKFME